MAFDIVFGWHLDGLTYPETCNAATANLGDMVTGPAGLISQLALRLGVCKPFVSQSVRIARYLKALAACDDGNQFYSASFALDSWSTASCLLVMRDQLISAGWDGKAISNETPKLRSIALVEEKANPLCSGAETLRSVLAALKCEQHPSIPIKRIQLKTPKSLLPKVWQEIFTLLDNTSIEVEELDGPDDFDVSHDLGKVQHYLTTGEKIELQNDGSFYLLEGDDEYQLAEVAAAWLSANSSDLEKLVAIRNAPSVVLDAFCNRYGLPRFGGHANSRWRSALQVLPLMLETCWLPANPRRTLELISLPESPISRTLSYHFIQALRAEPGFGGSRWSTAWTAAEEELRSNAQQIEELNGPDKQDTVCLEEKITSTLKSLRFWLEPQRHDPSGGMPIAQALAICRRVGQWASSNLRKEGASEMFLQALNSSKELEETIIESGLASIKKIQLERILDAVAGEGSKPERWHAQSASWSNVDHPGQIWGPANIVLWWGFTDNSQVYSQSDPWSPADLKCLEESSIHIDRPNQIAIREAYAWRQALLNVRNQLFLCRTRVRHGQQTSLHPVWQELEELIDSSKSWNACQAHKILSNPQPLVANKALQMKAVQAKSLPVAHRYWTAPAGRIVQRAKESVTSMRELFGCPMAWVLRYQAQLHKTGVLNLPDGDRLIGDIAHKLFRRLFEDGWSADQLTARAETYFDELVETVGLPLLLRGKNLERENAKRLLVDSVNEFGRLLRAAGLQVDGCEMHKEAAFGQGVFIGDLDILLKDKSGNSFIVDYKWNQGIKYRISEIEKAHHLQLAAYAWLESIETNKFGRVGYYMMRQRRLIHCGDTSLSIGQQVDSLPLAEIWENAENEFLSSIGLLSDGSICASGVQTDEAMPSTNRNFAIDPPCKFCDYGNICGETYSKPSMIGGSSNE
jgi:ATP-dependent helicase/nuclease subunit B